MKIEYKKDDFGIIHQLNPNKIEYDEKYISQYNDHGELSNYISYLRFGFIIGAIGSIPNSILDVGYGNGAFLKCCSNIVSNCYGNDISNYKIENINFVEDITKFHYDVITFFDSLEHFEDIEFIKDLKCNYICVSVPWCHNFNDEWFENWKHKKPNEHLHHFDKESLEKFMRSNGFSLISYSNIEDCIRKNNEDYPNILTCIFKNEKDIRKWNF